MIKRLSLAIVLIILVGCVGKDLTRDLAYNHSKFGIVKISEPVYLNASKNCEELYYSDPITINGKNISLKKDLDEIKREHEVYFGSTVHKKGLNDSQILAKYEEYKKTWPEYVHEN